MRTQPDTKDKCAWVPHPVSGGRKGAASHWAPPVPSRPWSSCSLHLYSYLQRSLKCSDALRFGKWCVSAVLPDPLSTGNCGPVSSVHLKTSPSVYYVPVPGLSTAVCCIQETKVAVATLKWTYRWPHFEGDAGEGTDGKQVLSCRGHCPRKGKQQGCELHRNGQLPGQVQDTQQKTEWPGELSPGSQWRR